jgi:hypothetical protein
MRPRLPVIMRLKPAGGSRPLDASDVLAEGVLQQA